MRKSYSSKLPEIGTIINALFSFQNPFIAQTNRMMGYMDGGRLPFDINDFATSSPKGNEAHIPVIDSTTSKENEIDDFFKTLMHDTYTPAIPPLPVPAVGTPNYYGSPFPTQQTSTYEFSQYENSNVNVSTNLFSSDANNSSYNQSYSGTFNASNTRPPLPSQSTSQRENWEMDMSWNTSQESSFNQSMDAPRSPPHYERKGINTNVIEYIEPDVNDSHVAGAGDVDHRQLILPMNGLNALGAKDRGRLIDVDHRNLISLTGSPKLTDKDANGSRVDTHTMVIFFYFGSLLFEFFYSKCCAFFRGLLRQIRNYCHHPHHQQCYCRRISASRTQVK